MKNRPSFSRQRYTTDFEPDLFPFRPADSTGSEWIPLLEAINQVINGDLFFGHSHFWGRRRRLVKAVCWFLGALVSSSERRPFPPCQCTRYTHTNHLEMCGQKVSFLFFVLNLFGWLPYLLVFAYMRIINL